MELLFSSTSGARGVLQEYAVDPFPGIRPRVEEIRNAKQLRGLRAVTDT
jgi:hypothetical protein